MISQEAVYLWSQRLEMGKQTIDREYTDGWLSWMEVGQQEGKVAHHRENPWTRLNSSKLLDCSDANSLWDIRQVTPLWVCFVYYFASEGKDWSR